MLDNEAHDAGEQAGNDAAASATDRNHNFLSSCAATILERYGRAKASTRASLDDLRVVGETLNEAKDTLKDTKGAFGEWCEAASFPFDKTWRARLMKLAANWDAIMAAVEALPEDKRKWSVDGVLAIWAASEKAKKDAEAGNGSGSGEAGEGEGGDTPSKPKKETEAEKLRRMLAEALAEVERLRAENETLKGGKAKAKAEDKADPAAEREARAKAKAGEPPRRPGTVDAGTKARARKVHVLWTKGGTEGEKSAAKERLDAMASKCGLDLASFVKACGL
jgi:hypothetical protein